MFSSLVYFIEKTFARETLNKIDVNLYSFIAFFCADLIRHVCRTTAVHLRETGSEVRHFIEKRSPDTALAYAECTFFNQGAQLNSR